MSKCRISENPFRNRTLSTASILAGILVLPGILFYSQVSIASNICLPDSKVPTVPTLGSETGRLLRYIDLLAQHANAELEQAQADGDSSQEKALQQFRDDVAATLELMKEYSWAESDPTSLQERAEEASSLLSQRYAKLKHARARSHAERVDNLESLGKIARGVQIGVTGAAVTVAGITTGGAGAAAMGAVLDGVSSTAEQYHEHGTVDPRQVAVHTASGAIQGAVGGALSKPIQRLATQLGSRLATRIGSAGAATVLTSASDLAMNTGSNVLIATAGAVGETAALSRDALTPGEAINITKASFASFASAEGLLGMTLTAVGRRAGLQAAGKTSPRTSQAAANLNTLKPNPHRTRVDFDYDPSALEELLSRAVLPDGERLPEATALEASLDNIKKLRARLEILQEKHEAAWQVRAVTEERRSAGIEISDAEYVTTRKNEISARTELLQAEREAYHINTMTRDAASRIEDSIHARIAMHSRKKNPFPYTDERDAIESGALKLALLDDLLTARLNDSQTERARRWGSFNYGKVRTPSQDRDTERRGETDSSLAHFNAELGANNSFGAERLLRTIRARTPGFSAISQEDQNLISRAATLMTDRERFHQFLGDVLKNPRVQTAEGTRQRRSRILATLAEDARRYGFRSIKVLPKRGLDTGEFASFLARRELFLDPAFRNGAHGEDTHLVQTVYLLQNLRNNSERYRIFELMAEHPQLWGELFDAGSGTLNQPETLGKGLRKHIGLQ